MCKFISLEESEELLNNLKKKKKKNSLSFNIRNEKLFNSAIHAPQNSYYKKIEDIATAYLQSCIHNHFLVDGNKRFAWLICKSFLGMNNYTLKNNKDKEYWGKILENYAANKLEFEDISKLLKENLSKL